MDKIKPRLIFDLAADAAFIIAGLVGAVWGVNAIIFGGKLSLVDTVKAVVLPTVILPEPPHFAIIGAAAAIATLMLGTTAAGVAFMQRDLGICADDQQTYISKNAIIAGISIFVVAILTTAIIAITIQPTQKAAKASGAILSGPTTPTYSTGTYLVGKDIPAGLYRATPTDTITNIGYIERASDISLSVSDIIANIILSGDGYVQILKSDVAVKLQGVELSPINLSSLTPNIQKTATDGMYLVGYDLAPGKYKAEVTDTVTGIGYVERASAATMEIGDIIANEAVQGQSYFKIESTDFVVRLQGVKITRQ